LAGLGRYPRNQPLALIQMATPMTLLLSFLRSESASIALTYSLIAMGIALVIINGAQAFGIDPNETLSRMAASIKRLTIT
jgi:Flp pilus assembly pilin Flp